MGVGATVLSGGLGRGSGSQVLEVGQGFSGHWLSGWVRTVKRRDFLGALFGGAVAAVVAPLAKTLPTDKTIVETQPVEVVSKVVISQELLNDCWVGDEIEREIYHAVMYGDRQ